MNRRICPPPGLRPRAGRITSTPGVPMDSSMPPVAKFHCPWAEDAPRRKCCPTHNRCDARPSRLPTPPVRIEGSLPRLPKWNNAPAWKWFRPPEPKRKAQTPERLLHRRAQRQARPATPLPALRPLGVTHSISWRSENKRLWKCKTRPDSYFAIRAGFPIAIASITRPQLNGIASAN